MRGSSYELRHADDRRSALRTCLAQAVGVAALVALVALPARAVSLFPVETTGHDTDIIFENDGSPAVTGNNELGSRWFFENGLFTTGTPTPVGLPTTRQITGFNSPSTFNTIDFTFNDYNGFNVLMFKANNAAPKTLSLVTPAKYGQLSFVYSGGSLGTTVVDVGYTINYEGGATQTGTFPAIDWSATLPTGVERLFVADRANTGPVLDGSRLTATRWAIYETEVTITNPGLNILSVDFNTTYTTPTGADVAIFGLSGDGNPPLLGDTDGDGVVEFEDDFNPIRNNFHKAVTTRAQGDLVRDGKVDFADFRQWRQAFVGNGGSLEGINFAALFGGVPEPSTAMLVIVAVAALAARRQRN
jgi:hypothetical protein